jgi:hypothetical protein
VPGTMPRRRPWLWALPLKQSLSVLLDLPGWPAATGQGERLERVSTRLRPALSVADWLAPDHLWLDHAAITSEDLGWLSPVRRLTMWAVKLPPRFLARLPLLDWVDVRGGSGKGLDFLVGCTRLRYLAINQVRGVDDLSELAALTNLELLSLYGLPQVKVIPSLARLQSLSRAHIGSMKGLSGLTGLLDAPHLAELQLLRAVSLAADDPARLRDLPSLTHFEWFAEDVPDKVWVPVRQLIDKPQTEPMHPEEWFAARARSSEDKVGTAAAHPPEPTNTKRP